MEAATERHVELFGETLPSIEQIRELSRYVHCGESNLLKFGEQVEEHIGKEGAKASLATGIGLYILGRDAEAVNKLEKGGDGKEKYLYLAFALRRMGECDRAIENLQKSLEYGADALNVALEKAATYRRASKFEAAKKQLDGLSNFEKVSAEYHYQRARLRESQGFYDEAVQDYKTAMELLPNHQGALFHLAYRCDLAGDEEAAIDYYKQIVSNAPVYVNALLNLAVLYEDMDDYDKASQCVNKVLKHHPNHQRAMLFKKDIESSKTMYYDEEKEKKKTHKTQLLETPISDFELSVRSRNCLRKMNIDTLGDLLNITEVELLSYKNFGETSLKEIKVVLEMKGLHLGMALEDKQRVIAEAAAEQSEEPVDEGLLNRSVEELQLSVRARKCLQKLNLRTLGELIAKTEAELLGVKNFGVTSLNEIKKAVNSLGMSLRRLD
jgi:DNA-directed RNA polymerase subunit alpha